MGAFLLAFFAIDKLFGKDLIILHQKAKTLKSKKYEVTTPPKSTSNHGKASHSADEKSGGEASAVITQVEESSGSVAEEVTFGDLLTAYQDSVMANLGPGERRDDITVRYYRHEPDGDVVLRLSELGYYVHVRAPTEGLGKLKTNSLYYGDDVDIKDIQLIARFLILNGIELCQIRPSRYHADWKADAIEIGSSREAEGIEPLTILDIEVFEKAY